METKTYVITAPEDFHAKLDAIFSVASDKPKEKQYPSGILSIQTNIGLVDYETAMRVKNNSQYQEWCRTSFEDYHGKIHSVKNGTGETLTVGDMTNYGKIELFEIVDGLLRVDVEERFEILRSVDEVHPAKVLLTEDGYEIKDKGTYHLVSEKTMAMITSVWGDQITLCGWHKVFAERENADHYIYMNQKSFSRADILAMSNESLSTLHTIYIDKTKLGID